MFWGEEAHAQALGVKGLGAWRPVWLQWGHRGLRERRLHRGSAGHGLGAFVGSGSRGEAESGVAPQEFHSTVLATVFWGVDQVGQGDFSTSSPRLDIR